MVEELLENKTPQEKDKIKYSSPSFGCFYVESFTKGGSSITGADYPFGPLVS